MMYHTDKSGFTLIETLVAITILLIAIAAPLSLSQQGIRGARLAQDQIVAFYLGQEGIEAVKNLRDHNRLGNRPQLSGELSNCLSPNESCTIDTVTRVDNKFQTERCPHTGCPNLYIQNINNMQVYTQKSSSTSTISKFNREIRVWYTPDNAGNENKGLSEAVVEVTVTWPFGADGDIREYRVQDYLYNW